MSVCGMIGSICFTSGCMPASRAFLACRAQRAAMKHGGVRQDHSRRMVSDKGSPPTPLPSFANPIMTRFSPSSPKMCLRAALRRSSKNGKNSATLKKRTPVSCRNRENDFGFSPSVYADIHGLPSLKRLRMLHHRRHRTSRQTRRPTGHELTRPLDQLHILLLDQICWHPTLLDQYGLDVVRGFGILNCRHEGSVEAVVGVEGFGGVAVEEEGEVDEP